MSGTVKDCLFILLILALAFGGLFGFVYLIQRSSEAQARTGRPSWLIRVTAIVVFGALIVGILSDIENVELWVVLWLGLEVILWIAARTAK